MVKGQGEAGKHSDTARNCQVEIATVIVVARGGPYVIGIKILHRVPIGDGSERSVGVVQVEGIHPLIVGNKNVEITIVVKISPDAVNITAFDGDNVTRGDFGEIG